MIILDTNVISEIMKAEPDQAVAKWLDAQILRSLYITTINVMELRYGVELLPGGKGKEALWKVLNFTIIRLFGNRLLNFDQHAAIAAAKIAAETKNRGINLSTADTQIAGIALANKFIVASRDIRPFTEVGVTLINPFEFG